MKPPAIPPESGAPLRRVWYAFLHFLSRIAVILLFDYRFRGLDNVPAAGGLVLASNHQSFLDPVLVGVCQRRNPCYLARDGLFRVPGLGWLIRSLNALPVVRESAAPRQGLELSIRALEAGRALVLFPEGTRTADGAMGPLRRGIYLVARQSGGAIVPVFIDGAFGVWPRRARFPVPGPIRVAFGPPLRCGRETDGAGEEEGGGEGGISAAGKSDGTFSDIVDNVRSLSAAGGPGGGSDLSAGSGSGGRRGKKPSAAFLEELGEAYRALREEAGKRRRGSVPATFFSRLMLGTPGKPPTRVPGR